MMTKQENMVLEQRAKSFIDHSLPDMMKKEKAFFDKMAENTRLNAQQHAFLAEMATVRHYIHCHPEQIFFSTKLQRKIEAFMGYIVYQESVNALGIDFPYDVCRQFSELPHYALNKNYKPRELVVNITIFEDAADELNTAFEDYLKSIGSKYGVDYSPTGWLREERNLSEDHTYNKILNLYFTQGMQIADNLTVIQFETELRKTLIETYPSLNGHIDLRFDKELVDRDGTKSYNVFVEAEDFLKVPVDSLQFRGFTVNLNPVIETKAEVDIEFPRRKKLLETSIER